MGDGKGARDEDDAVDTSPQADQKPIDPTDDASREPTRPVTPSGPDMSPPGAEPSKGAKNEQNSRDKE